MSFTRWDSLNLWSSPGHFWLESPSDKSHLMSISRKAAEGEKAVEMVVQSGQCNVIPSTATRRSVHGVLGIMELPLGSALIVITRKMKVGEVAGQVVWRLESVDIIPFGVRQSSSAAAVEAQRRCLSMAMEMMATPYFYFSYGGDLTNSQQRLDEQSKSIGQLSGLESWRRLDRRFVWNSALLLPLLEAAQTNELYRFVLPIIHGAVFIHRCSINSKDFTWALISRRSRFRTGTRFFARGGDKSGNVANFCETEQLVEHGKLLASYVQTRGSMPFMWSQTPNIKYMPVPRITGRPDDNEACLRAHFAEQTAIYGEQVIINLVNQTKVEGELEKTYSKLVDTTRLAGVNYEPFDFHRECSKMRYERLSLLVDQLARYDFGFFSSNSKQTGVFRTNCMDCLDRTNVVQSVLALENLARVLHSFGVISAPAAAEIERVSTFQKVYRNSWADHANLISMQYAGTGALKTDYTRTGARTTWGLLQDGWNAANRYVRNNFRDGRRTDAIHYFLGELRPAEVVEAARLARSSEGEAGVLQYLPHAGLAFGLLLVATLLFSPRASLSMLATCLLCIAVMYAVAHLMAKNCRQFVDYPVTLRWPGRGQERKHH